MRQILVGIDESEGAAAALRWAIDESKLDNAGVTAIMAWDWLNQHHRVGEDFDPSYGEDDARTEMAGIIEAALGGGHDARLETRVVADLPARALLDASAGADLLVVGARGTGGFSGLLLGSVAQQCLHHSEIPIAIIRPGTTTQSADAARIVAAVDGSDTALRALQWAAEEARLRSAALDVVNTWLRPLYAETAFGRLVIDSGDYENESRQIVRDAVAAVDTEGVHVNPISLERAAVKGILDTADGAGLLVVGSRGRSVLKRTVFGSVATQISHHALCPLVVVPAADPGS